MNREFDILIWGASGFTGRLVVQYLLNQYGVNQSLRWAVGGRNGAKLARVMEEIGAQEVPILIADSHDLAALEEMATRTKVVCTTVGPYALYGTKMVQACISSGTHYCDLTGEVPWMRRMIDAHHQAAQEKQVRIVHTCGFDSIPSDMGVYFFQKQVKEATGEYCQHIRFRLKASKGGASGGTIASMMNILTESEKDPSILDVLADPYSLNPEGMREGKDGPDLMDSAYDPIAKAHIAPFVMGTINTRVVRRSHALSGMPYGGDFQYDEASLTGKGVSGKLKAGVMSFAMGMLTNASPSSMMGKLMGNFLPKPGEGPSEQVRETGFFVIDLYGSMANGEVHKARVKGDRDPGYGSTSKMLGESAVCLALDSLDSPYGMLTPSTAMGDHLLERLQKNAGLSFELKSPR